MTGTLNVKAPGMCVSVRPGLLLVRKQSFGARLGSWCVNVSLVNHRRQTCNQ